MEESVGKSSSSVTQQSVKLAQTAATSSEELKELLGQVACFLHQSPERVRANKPVLQTISKNDTTKSKNGFVIDIMRMMRLYRMITESNQHILDELDLTDTNGQDVKIILDAAEAVGGLLATLGSKFGVLFQTLHQLQHAAGELVNASIEYSRKVIDLGNLFDDMWKGTEKIASGISHIATQLSHVVGIEAGSTVVKQYRDVLEPLAGYVVDASNIAATTSGVALTVGELLGHTSMVQSASTVHLVSHTVLKFAGATWLYLHESEQRQQHHSSPTHKTTEEKNDDTTSTPQSEPNEPSREKHILGAIEDGGKIAGDLIITASESMQKPLKEAKVIMEKVSKGFEKKHKEMRMAPPPEQQTEEQRPLDIPTPTNGQNGFEEREENRTQRGFPFFDIFSRKEAE